MSRTTSHRGNLGKHKEAAPEAYWERLRSGLSACGWERSGAYRPAHTTQRKILKPNTLEMEYEQTCIELEGPLSKKWPGANRMEEATPNPRLTRAIGQDE